MLKKKKFKVKIEYSHRHIHVTKEVIERLFGSGYILESEKKLSQGDDFATPETVTLIGPKGKLENVKILGPARDKTQIEILKSDTFVLGIEAPLRLSGDLEYTPGIKIVSNFNEIDLEEGVIIAKRHLHVSPEEAQKMGLKNGQKVKLEVKGERALIFDEIIVRIKEGFEARVHLDLEEANTAGIKQNDQGELIT